MKRSLSEPAVLLSEARAALQRTHPLLLDPSPANVDQCSPHLFLAHQKIQDLHQALAQSPSSGLAIKQSAETLRGEIRVIGALLEHAAAYHSGLLQKMIAASQDEAAMIGPGDPSGRVQLEG